MKRLLFILFAAISYHGYSQYQEIGLMVSTAYYIGDLNPNSHIPKELSPGGGLIYRYNFNDRVALRAHALYGRIHGRDHDSKNPWRKNRNLSFRSDIFEFGAQVEINFLTYEIGDPNRPSSPYLFGGLSIFRFNPQTLYNDRWIDLQPLGTEGQGMKGYDKRYSLTQISIPFGVGFKFNIWRSFAASLEWGMRKTFTDYLDDVSTQYVEFNKLLLENGPLAAELADRSYIPLGPDGSNTDMQRGETNHNDWYIFTGVILTFKLGEPKIKCPTPRN